MRNGSCSPRVVTVDRARMLSGVRYSSLVGALCICIAGCATNGSSFGSGGSNASGSGGAFASSGGSTGASGGSVGSSGGTTGNGSGGETAAGSGGSIGSGGDVGSGGANAGTGGTGPTSSGGGTASGTGGGTASGGTGPGSGGRVGTGGTTASGGSGTAGRLGSASGGAGGSVSAACPKPAGQICHEFFANDNSRNQLNYVNEFDPSKNWTVNVGDTTANSPRTIEIVDNAAAKTGKAVLVSLNKGYGEFDVVDGKSLTKVLQYTGVTGACRIPADGTTALGTNDLIRIVSATGSSVRTFALPAGPELRAINRNPTTGNFWFSKTESIYEVTAQGAQVWTANLGAGAKGYAVWWRTGGGAYATTGDPSTVIELNAAGSPVNQVGTKAAFPFLDFFSGFVRLANGNYVVANWLGHLAQPAGDTPHIVELTSQDTALLPKNSLVWKWGNQTLARQITNVFVIR